MKNKHVQSGGLKSADQLEIGLAETVTGLLPIIQPIMRAIAQAVGPNCEVVLHDLSGDVEKTIVAIENEHVTGRSVGGTATNLGLEVLQSPHAGGNEFGYQAITADGRDLRCSSVYFRNKDGDVFAALCVNLDLTDLQNAKNLIDAHLQFFGHTEQKEIFAPDITTLLDGMIADAISQVGKPVASMEKRERLRVFEILEGRGAFVVKRSVDKVAARLRISRVTAYAYLDEIKSVKTD